MTSMFVVAWNSVSGLLTGGTPNSDKDTFKALDDKGRCRSGDDDFKLVFKTARTAAHDEASGAVSTPVFKSIRGAQETEQVADPDLCEDAGVVLLYPGIWRQNGDQDSPRSSLRDYKTRGGKDDDVSVGAGYNDELWGAADCDEFVFRPRS